MEVDWIWWIALLVVLVLFSAFFSGSETALVGSTRVKLNHLAEKGVRGASQALDLIRKPGELLNVILVGNNLVNVMAAAVATMLIGPVYASILVTLLLLVFAEITPKSLAAHEPERFAVKVAAPVRFFGGLFRPIVWLTSGLTDLFLWPIMGRNQLRERRFSRQELLTAIKLGARDGELEPSETRMTRGILSLKDMPVGRIMISLDDVDGINEAADYEEMMRQVAVAANTRYPVYRNAISEIVGILVVKDLLMHRQAAEENWRKYVRPIMRCKPDLEADELLRDMQIQRSHMAAVENHAGQIIGIVTMEDVLEEIVGEIQDEHDDKEGDLIREHSPGRYMVKGDAKVDDVCKVINVDLGSADQSLVMTNWFEKRCQVDCLHTRRLKIGNARVVPRSGNRFEILIKRQVDETYGSN